MRVIYKLLLVSFGLLYFAITVFMPAHAKAATAKLILSTPTASITNGTEFNVTLKVNPGISISGLSTDVTYNPSQLTYVSYSEYATAFPELWAFTPDSGKLSDTRSAGSEVSGSSIVVTYKFKAVAGSGQSTIEALGSAISGGSELALAKSTLILNLSSNSPSGGNNPSPIQPSATQDSGVSTNSAIPEKNNTDNQSQSVNAVIEPDPSSSDLKASNSVSNTLGSISNIVSAKNKFPFILIILGLVATSGGGWYLLRRRKIMQNAGHFPDVGSVPSSTNNDLHADIFTGTNQLDTTTISPTDTNIQPNTLATPSQTTIPTQTETPIQQPQNPVPNDPIPASAVVEPFVIQPTEPQAPKQTPVLPQQPANNAVVMPERTMAEPNEDPKTY